MSHQNEIRANPSNELKLSVGPTEVKADTDNLIKQPALEHPLGLAKKTIGVQQRLQRRFMMS